MEPANFKQQKIELIGTLKALFDVMRKNKDGISVNEKRKIIDVAVKDMPNESELSYFLVEHFKCY